jgi:hypothetical protein
MPFGLNSAPQSFSKCTTLVLGEALGVHAIACLDNMIILSPTLDEHFKSIEAVLRRLRFTTKHVKLVKSEFV